MRFWRRDRELHRLEAELRAARNDAPTEFIRTLVGSQREPRWLRPRLRIGVAVALGALVLAAMASAGGVGVIKQGTRATWHVVNRSTHKSKPRVLLGSSAASAQYERHCGGPTEPPCYITIYDAQVREGDSGFTSLVFTLSLDAIPSVDVTVRWDTTTRLGTATGGAGCAPMVDYVHQSLVATFPAGTSSITVTVPVCGDTVPEPNETLYVTLSDQSPNAVIARFQAQGTIINDDH
jgi:hypothetical protein